MAETITGGCQCGAIRYAVTGEAEMLYVCHCKECQKQSASAFGMSMPLPRTAFRLTRGTPRQWRRRADSGRTVVGSFCPDCGTRLFHNSSRGPDYLNLKPGSLDDTAWLRPVGHLWTRSAQSWLSLADDALTFSSQPDDFSGLAEQWRAQRGAGG